jgi:hypothetical protein
MNRTCWIVVVGLVAVVLAAVLGSCRPEPEAMVTYRIVAPCDLLDVNGKLVEEIWARRSTSIKWINETQGDVVVFFEPTGVMGSANPYIFLPSGSSRVTITSSSGFSSEQYYARVKCEGIKGPTPPIMECPPPPEPCP